MLHKAKPNCAQPIVAYISYSSHRLPKPSSNKSEKKPIKGKMDCGPQEVSAKGACLGCAQGHLPAATALAFIMCRDRWRVNSCGKACSNSKTFHLVIARGSQPGQRHVLEGEGDETQDTLPGDLVFVLQQKPHAGFQRSGVSSNDPAWMIQLGCHRLGTLSTSAPSSCCGCPLAHTAQNNGLVAVERFECCPVAVTMVAAKCQHSLPLSLVAAFGFTAVKTPFTAAEAHVIGIRAALPRIHINPGLQCNLPYS